MPFISRKCFRLIDRVAVTIDCLGLPRSQSLIALMALALANVIQGLRSGWQQGELHAAVLG